MSSPTQITLEQAYEEACQALGEAIVEKRLMARAASQQIETLTAEKATSADDLLHHAKAAQDEKAT